MHKQTNDLFAYRGLSCEEKSRPELTQGALRQNTALGDLGVREKCYGFSLEYQPNKTAWAYQSAAPEN
jgi:hypothetical protein